MSESADSLADSRRELISTQEHNERLKTALREAKTQLEAMREEILRVGNPPLRFAIFEGFEDTGKQALVVQDGKHLKIALNDTPEIATLQPGDGIWLDENLVGIAPSVERGDGTLGTVLEVKDSRAVVKLASGNEVVVNLSAVLAPQVKSGDTLRVDARNLWGMEIIERTGVEQTLSLEPPGVTYADIGGLEKEITAIRNAVELPYKHPEMFQKYGLRPPRGVLLYGPPGCGKTMLAKAVASSLGDGDNPSVFLSVKGPELLSKFVGETERQIRAIFDRARELSSGTRPVVVFFDEMEALFRTRGSGISSDVENMLVPQLLTEMDGLEELQNVIVIGASNREDMIDPALLRPGRFDVKIRVGRPDVSAAREILAHHLNPATPFDSSEVKAAGGATVFAVNLTEAATNRLLVRTPETYLCTLKYTDIAGNKQSREVFFSDMISGALLVAVAERAKQLAISSELAGQGAGIRLTDLDEALRYTVDQAATLTALLPPESLARDLGIQGQIGSIVREAPGGKRPKTNESEGVL